MSDPTPRTSADRNLLFGILALQMDFVTRDALIVAMNAWVLDKTKSLGQILCEQGALSVPRRTLLDALVQEHLNQHGNDAEQSLAALSTPSGLRDDLRRLADPDLDASLAHFVLAHRPDGDGGATVDHVGVRDMPGALRYRVLRPHAKGGLGEVFVAEDTELRREVALKEIRAERADDPASRGRFLLEAEVNGRLEHPGIVPVYGLGQHANGRPYYAMRLIQGETGKDAIARFHATDQRRADPGERSLALRQLLSRFVAVCNVIAYAHSRGVLHRDVKPANVMLGKYGETLVVDWGLAKVVGRPDAASADGEVTLRPVSAGEVLTQAGAALGTPAYMAPEQAAGRLDQLGPASDIYGLGATLYCLLTGQPPFRGEDAGDLLQRVMKGMWLPPRQVKPEVPAALDAICRKAMALRPEDRYGSALALAADVEHWLADEPVSAWPEPLAVKARRWLGRHRTLVTGTAAAVLVAVVSLAVATVLLTAANKEERKAKEKADAALLHAEWLVYAGKISLAQREWEANNVGVARDLLDGCRSDFRGWEHDYLHVLFNSNQRTLRGHSSNVDSVAFSPDGKRLVSGSFDKTVKVWDLTTGQATLTLKGHTNGVTSVAFSPDGKRLASASHDNTVKVWDATTGQAILTLKGHTGLVSSVAFSPDGKRLVSAGDFNNTAKVWDLMTGRDTLALKGHKSMVSSLAFSPDGKRLASGSLDNTVKVWDAATSQATLTLQGHTSWVTSVAFSPDGKRLVSADFDKTVKVWDLATGQATLTLQGNSGMVSSVGTVCSVAFSPDGKHLISASQDNALKVWDATTGQDSLTLQGNSGMVSSVAFSPDGKRLASGSQDGTVKVWVAATSQATLTLQGHTSGVTSVAFSPDGKRLVSASQDKTLKMWDATTGQNTRTFQGHTNSVSSVAFSPDAKRLVSGSSDKTVKVWEATTGRDILTLQGHTDVVNSVAFSPDGKRLASSAGNLGARGVPSEVKVWDATTGQATLTLQGHTDVATSVAFSPDAKRLVTGIFDGTVKVWDLTTGRATLTLEGHTAVVTSVAFSPDGKRLASSAGNVFRARGVPGMVKVWDATTGQATLTLKGHNSMVSSVAFSPDGKRLVSGSSDGTVKVWEATTGQDLLTLRGHTGEVTSLAFSPDGKRLVSASGDGTVKVWDATMSQRRD
jgi:WD40 repeat protein/serine/threonine protein kinase